MKIFKGNFFSYKRVIENLKIKTLIPILFIGLIGGIIGTTLPRFLNSRNLEAQFNEGIQGITDFSSEDEVTRVVEKSLPSIVYIVTDVEDEGEVIVGSGFAVTECNCIVTNNHVLDRLSTEFRVKNNKSEEIKVTQTDLYPNYDVAVLIIDGDYKEGLHLSNSNDLKLGQKVVAIGSQFGYFENSITYGIISGLNRELEFTEFPVIQVDAALNPGNSGGPLLNLNGEVVGMNFAVNSMAENMGFAIPANDLEEILSVY